MPFIHPRSWNFSLKFALIITAVVAGVAFTIGAVIVMQDRQRFRLDLEDKAILLARSVAVTAPDHILRNDSWALYRSLKKMAVLGPERIRDTKILTGMVLSPNGVVLAHLQPSEHPIGLPFQTTDQTERNLLRT
ncbi:MAG: hypothetical protein OEY85_10175, partial [Rhodospirillales bacterium]|nr:hypothetical protein [Rhodospirillales bacterium]